MVKRLVIFSFMFVLMVSLSGCVTTIKKTDEQLESLKNQVSSLESQLQSKEEEINNLRCALSKTEETQSIIRKCDITGRPNTRQIQTALLNAGYDPGAVDGKMGKKTKDAIKSFQSANNLVADGKAGSKTWALLKECLYKKSK